MTNPHELELNLYIFILAGFLGYRIISRVPPLLHTPLMSATNALSGISLIGSLVVAADGKHASTILLYCRGLLIHQWSAVFSSPTACLVCFTTICHGGNGRADRHRRVVFRGSWRGVGVRNSQKRYSKGVLRYLYIVSPCCLYSASRVALGTT
jgi:hypothetical protein